MEGTVRSAGTRRPLESVTVVAKSGDVEVGSVTNADGKYRVQVPVSGNFVLNFHYLDETITKRVRLETGSIIVVDAAIRSPYSREAPSPLFRRASDAGVW